MRTHPWKFPQILYQFEDRSGKDRRRCDVRFIYCKSFPKNSWELSNKVVIFLPRLRQLSLLEYIYVLKNQTWSQPQVFYNPSSESVKAHTLTFYCFSRWALWEHQDIKLQFAPTQPCTLLISIPKLFVHSLTVISNAGIQSLRHYYCKFCTGVVSERVIYQLHKSFS